MSELSEKALATGRRCGFTDDEMRAGLFNPRLHDIAAYYAMKPRAREQMLFNLWMEKRQKARAILRSPSPAS